MTGGELIIFFRRLEKSVKKTRAKALFLAILILMSIFSYRTHASGFENQDISNSNKKENISDKIEEKSDIEVKSEDKEKEIKSDVESEEEEEEKGINKKVVLQEAPGKKSEDYKTLEISDYNSDNLSKEEVNNFTGFVKEIDYNLLPLTDFTDSIARVRRARAANTHPVNPGDVELFKYAEPVEGKVNTWDITLRVEGKDLVKTSDIVLVMDTSGSMLLNNRMVEAKLAANSFIDTLLPSKTTRIGLVSFASDYNIESGLSNQKSILKNRVNSLVARGGTFTQAGLKQAQEMLKNSNADYKHIVLLSDGEPTYSYAIYNPNVYMSNQYIESASYDNGYNYYVRDYRLATNSLVDEHYFNYTTKVGRGTNIFHNYYQGMGFYNHGNSAIAQAGFAKNRGYNIWSIALEAGSMGESVLRQIASPVSYYTADPSSLNTIFRNIAGSINGAVRDAKIIDPMGFGFEIKDPSSISVSQGSTKYENGKLYWDPGNLTMPIYEGSDIRYAELKYRIEINDDILTAKPDEYGGFATNGDAKVTYIDSSGGKISKKFPVPSVHPVLYTVEKIVEDYLGNRINPDINFNVRVKDDAGNYFKDYILNVSESNKRVLTSLRDKAIYSFEETEIPDKYEAFYYLNGRQVTDKTFIVDSDKSEPIELKVVNREKSLNIDVEKIWENSSNNKIPDSIKIKLMGRVKNEIIVEKEAVLKKNLQGKWVHRFDKLPKYYGNDLIVYELEEEKVLNYTSLIEAKADGSFIIKNIGDMLLRVNKEVSGNMADKDKEFIFSYKIFNKDKSIESFGNFKLRHGEHRDIKLPYGKTIKIEENLYQDYRTYVNGQNTREYYFEYSKVEDRDFVEINYNNNKNLLIPTGLRAFTSPIVILFLLTLFFAISYFVINKRKKFLKNLEE